MTSDELRAMAERLVEMGQDEDALLGQRIWDGVYLARAYLAKQEIDDIRVLRLRAAIASALPYIEVPHVRASFQRAIEETKLDMKNRQN